MTLSRLYHHYGQSLCQQSRPKTRKSRSKSYKSIDKQELFKFLGLCLLRGQTKNCDIRRLFSLNPLNYFPIFPITMSGRRFVQILRCFSAHKKQELTTETDILKKIRNILDLCIRNFQACYKPSQQLSLDESLLLFRGRSSFRTDMKNKKKLSMASSFMKFVV